LRAQPLTAPDRRQKAARSELSLKIERGILLAGDGLELRVGQPILRLASISNVP
jgi:hypothetical protein